MPETEIEETETREKDLLNELFRLKAILRAIHALSMDLNDGQDADPEKLNDAEHLAELSLEHLEATIETFCIGVGVTPGVIRAGQEVLYKVEPPKGPTLEEKKATLEWTRSIVEKLEAEIKELEGKEAKDAKDGHDKEA